MIRFDLFVTQEVEGQCPRGKAYQERLVEGADDPASVPVQVVFGQRV